MNDGSTNDMKNEHEKLARILNQTAEGTNPNPHFIAGLERDLIQLHGQTKSEPGRFHFTRRRAVSALAWTISLIALALFMNWVIGSVAPVPTSMPAANVTSTPDASATGTPANGESQTTPVPNGEGYDFHGAKLLLQQSLPESPAEASVYLMKKDEPATAAEARALADRFGIQGEAYTAPGLIYGTTDYAFSDGKQFLQVYSSRYFIYTADIVKNNRNPNGTPNDNAESIIREFLQARGFDFPFNVSPTDFMGGYLVQPLSPDSIPMQYEPFAQPVMRVTLDENGEVLSVNASLMDYDPTPVGRYGIITAQEALQRLLDDNIPAGKMESFHSPSAQTQNWYREYPNDQPVTIHGYVTSNPAAEPGKPALILIDGVPATGNTAGLEKLDYYTFVEAQGQYIVENGIRKFKVEAWNTDAVSAYVSGTLHREGDQIVLTSDDGSGAQYPLIDPPADAPLGTVIPDSQLSIQGVIVDGKLDWQTIYYRPDANRSGGGGGGGGLGFYKLNLSGTPVPFPTVTPQGNANPGTGEYIIREGDTLSKIAQEHGITVDQLMQMNGLTDPMIFVGQTLIVPAVEFVPQNVEDLRGFLSITIHKKADGTESREYGLTVSQDQATQFYQLEGPNLNELDAYNALPILVSGTIDGTNHLVMDHYTIPFPDLQFQILRGTQRSEQVNGQTAVIFTTEDGKSYVEFAASTDQLTNAFIGIQGDTIQQEVLIVPDETFGGMPVVHIYQGSILEAGASQMQVQANQIPVIDDTQFPDVPNYAPPDLVVDKVELVYFASSPYYQVNDPNYDGRSPYIEPVWHFHGRYDDGSGFDALIQALQQEFLLPEVLPGASPG